VRLTHYREAEKAARSLANSVLVMPHPLGFMTSSKKRHSCDAMDKASLALTYK